MLGYLCSILYLALLAPGMRLSKLYEYVAYQRCCSCFAPLFKRNSEFSTVTFSADKETMELDTGNMKVADILSQFNKKCKEKEQKS
jgi:hypothetical protein